MISRQEYFTISILNKLTQNADLIKRKWANPVGTNTRYFILDDLLDPHECIDIYKAFPRGGNGFIFHNSFREKKKTSAYLFSLDQIFSDIIYAFQDKRIVDSIANLVDFNELQPDPELYAGGLSMMFFSDFLNPHIDNSHDSKIKKYRRLNLLYYVTPKWKKENGGNFELWDDRKKIPVVIPSLFNRLVVMETNKYSWHSVSPVRIHHPRCCISTYYFSNHSPDDTSYFHITKFTGRPNQKIKKIIGLFDNLIRNIISKNLKIGRGKKLTNKK